MPFDGKRMIYGGFETIVEQGEHTGDSYVQGFIVPVPASKREAYRKLAEEAWTMFKGYGALRVVEAWDDEVPDADRPDRRLHDMDDPADREGPGRRGLLRCSALPGVHPRSPSARYG